MVRLRRSVAIAALCGLGVAAAIAFVTPGADAATVPAPWEPVAAAEVGTVGFYDASGRQVFDGNLTDAPTAAYLVGSAAPGSGDTAAVVEVCTPSTSAVPADWPCISSRPTSFPVSSGPQAVQTLSQTKPTFTGQSADGSLLAAAIAQAPNTSTADGYAAIYQLRLLTENAAGQLSATYDAADVQVNASDATFQVVHGTGVAATPGSGVEVSTPGGMVEVMAPVGGVLSGVNDTPTATLPTPLPPELTAPDGAIGYTVSGVATGSTVSVTITLTFHPAAYLLVDASGALYNAGSMVQINGNTVTLSVTDGGLGDDNNATGGIITDPGIPVMAPPTYVATLFTASTGSLTVGHAVTLTATVSFVGTACPTTGTVSYMDLGDPTMTGQITTTIFQTSASTFQQGPGLFAGTVGCTVVHATSALTVGLHLIDAEWTPSGFTTGFPGGSVLLTVTAPTACAESGSSCTDQQSVEAGIPVGTITITTPYNGSAGCAGSQPSGAATPVTITPGADPNINTATSTPGCVNGVLNLGTLALNSTDSMFTANTTFQDISVTDSLSGVQLWTASAQSSDLTDGGTNAGSTIDSQNVGLTNIVESTADEGSNHFTGHVVASNNPAASPAVGPAAAGTAGLGGGTQHVVLTATTPGLGTYTADGTITLNAPVTTEAGVFKGTITFTVATS
jgi:hypothetical protein